MKLNLKNVFLSVGITIFSLAFFGFVSVSKADAAICTAVATGNWNVTGTWDACVDGPVVGGGDTVIIPSNYTVTITGADAHATVLTLSGTSTLTVSGTQALAVSGVTTIGAGTTLNTGATGVVSPTGGLNIYGALNIGGGTFNSVGGPTHIYPTGILTFYTAAGTKSFAAVTVDALGKYNESTWVSTVTLGDINNAGTMTLNTSGHTLAGITNTGTLNYAVTTPAFTTLTTSTLGTINYNGGDQDTVQVIPYNNLTFSGTGTKGAAALVIGGTLAINNGVTVSLTGNSTAKTLTIGGTPMRAGIWGPLGSAAPLQNAAFTGSSYHVTVTTSTQPPTTTTTAITNNADCSTTTTVTENGSVVSTTRTGGSCSGTTTDTTAPMGMVSINAGALTTSSLSSTLTLTAVDATQMLISNDAGFAGASWESYAGSKAWTLTSGDGVKTVYAKFKDAALNTSATVSDTITVVGSGTVAVVSNEPTQGCSGGNVYNTSTGALCINNAAPQGCSAGNVYNTSTGATCVNNAKLEIPGCGNRNTGFSTADGQSCVENRVTTPTTDVIKFTKAVTTKSLKADIEKLQTALNTIIGGGVGTALIVDGQWGPKTTFVVKAFQKANGLTNDGKVGPKTMAKLNALLGL